LIGMILLRKRFLEEKKKRVASIITATL